MTVPTIRADLADAQRAAWDHVTSPGSSWSSVERAAIARVVLAALDDDQVLAPWVTPSAVKRALPGADVLPVAVSDAVYRMARHASTLTEGWYSAQIELGIDPVAFVEIVGVVVAVAAVDGFFRAAGLDRPPLPEPDDRPAVGGHPPVESATLNWVPVASPADRFPAVVQALTAVPAEFEMLARLHAVQYIPMLEMGELGWSRGTLSRPEMEFVAARLSEARECFY